MTRSILTRTIEERRVDSRRLGRHLAHDPKSRGFPAETASKLKSVRHKSVGLPLIQTRGSCTAEALCGARNTEPDYRGGHVYDQADADSLYNREIVLEGGDPAVDDPGGTGLYVCRAAKAAGMIRLYRHAFGLDHALHALTLRPVITGVDWYEGFDTPDGNGLVVIFGSIRGGHEIVADEIDVEHQVVWYWNSWGSDWGKGGRFCMSFSTWGKLLDQQGDVTVPYV